MSYFFDVIQCIEMRTWINLLKNKKSDIKRTKFQVYYVNNVFMKSPGIPLLSVFRGVSVLRFIPKRRAVVSL